jgi:putative two-component system response regulator
MNTEHILVVDDDDAVATLLAELLLADGFRVTIAHEGREALALVAADRPDLILTDLDMPLVNGNELCYQIKRTPATRLLPVLMITGNNEHAAKLCAWEMGVDDFLTKPIDSIEVRTRCRSLLRIKRLVDELDSAESVVFAFARAVEAKSRFTWGHSERVTTTAITLAQSVGVSEADLMILQKGAILHDIGKLSTPDAILNKPGALTDAEYTIIKEHPLEGVRIVEPLRSIRDTIPLIRGHHERLDGKGYPDGLRGDAIPLLTRILSIADVFDALSSERPYRPALAKQECLAILRQNAASGGLDVKLVQVFCEAQEAK